MVKNILIFLILSGGILSARSQPLDFKGNRWQISKKGQVGSTKTNPIPDELVSRIKMVTDRIVFGDDPKITEDFLLAGVTLDPQFSRRFTEFSGDQCGRYLSAFSRIQIPGNPVNLKDLAGKIIRTQKADGRFGNDQLAFDDPLKLEGNHMALLWGNGRLLTGLMDYYAYCKDPAVLHSAAKLGDFLLKTAQSCTQKEVVERFKTKGAMGYICFTQITDGLVKLYEQTSDKKYLENASAIYPLLPSLGNQHSHGFLNTLLGVMRLYQVTKDRQHLDYVEKIYRQVVDAPDFLITGGVPEFFDVTGPKPGSRDEGCSEADFIMVSIELWKATGKTEYLERAEYSLYNELMYNQFDSGDFGSHPIDQNFGFGVATSQGRCWWCCDYHGLQAMLEAKKIIVTATDSRKQVNLYAYSTFKDADLAFTLSKKINSGSSYLLHIDSGNSRNKVIALRLPGWAKKTELQLNGKTITGITENGYLLLDRIWKSADQLEIKFDYAFKLTSSDHHTYSLTAMPATLRKAALQYGPYLLCVDDASGTPFLAEPSWGNIVYLPANGLDASAKADIKVPASSNLQEAYLELNYKHEGYYATGKVIMRPVSEVSYSRQGNTRLWFNFEKK
jgi:DUF1680 family protein